jgi:hypothetical protein
LICEGGLKNVIENDVEIPKRAIMDKMIFSGVACLREDIFDEASPFFYDSKLNP